MDWRMVSCSTCQPAAKASGSRSKARRRSTTAMRASRLLSPVTSTHNPKRSRSWGRSSPSSGFMVPTRIKRAGWANEIPSRSTTLTPMAAASNSTSTRWSSNRFTSSTYKIPRLAAASKPGSKCFSPLLRAASRSMVPRRRSSVVPRGKSTTAMGRSRRGRTSP